MQDASPTDRAGMVSPAQPDIFSPLISAAIFGYYGFLNDTVRDVTDDQTGQTVPLWIGFLWSMRLVALLFVLSVVMALRRTRGSLFVSGLGGMLAALLLAAFAVWDAMDQQYMLAAPGWLLVLFAAWNGYASAGSLRDGVRELRG
ncbi:MAG: hypothetical protein QM516_06415 [Limnohabitans sp.]|jgi:hypothetical protein|nr:hypothetical protein [Limnohabitans sp.]